jgi:hypothetical protein
MEDVGLHGLIAAIRYVDDFFAVNDISLIHHSALIGCLDLTSETAQSSSCGLPSAQRIDRTRRSSCGSSGARDCAGVRGSRANVGGGRRFWVGRPDKVDLGLLEGHERGQVISLCANARLNGESC